MRRIREKLHSEAGVSFLFALVAFLVAAMVAATLISATVSSLKRVYSDREERQAHLTLTSAAQLVRDKMEQTSVETVRIVRSGGGHSETTTDVLVEGAFGSEMREASDYVNTYGNAYSGDGITLEVKNLDMEPVHLSFIMKSDEGERYKVIFTFTVDGSDGTLFLTMDGVVSGPSEETSTDENGIVTRTRRTKITWGQPIINGIGG